MLKFILGLVIGGIIGFLVFAVLSIKNSDKERKRPSLTDKDRGEENVSSK